MEKWRDIGLAKMTKLSPNESQKFTPAESLTLLNPKHADGKKMITLTFIDLLLKKVIEVSSLEDRDPILDEKAIRILRGENYSKITLKPHESIIADCVPAPGIKLYDLIRAIFGTIGAFWCYKINQVEYPLYEKGYLKREERKFLFVPIYYRYPLSDKGIEACSRIRNSSEYLENPDLWQKDMPDRAETYLAACGGNAFLRDSRYPYYVKVVEEWLRVLSKVEAEARSS